MPTDHNMPSTRDIAREMSLMLDDGPVLVVDALPAAIDATPAETLAAIAELLELAVCAVYTDPAGSGAPPFIASDGGDLPLEQFADPADGLAAVAEALGVGPEVDA